MRAGYLAITYHTLKAIFPECPGLPRRAGAVLCHSHAGFFGAGPQNPDRKARPAGPRRLRYVRSYYLLADLSISRHEYVRQLLEEQTAGINTDLSPQSYLYDLIITGAREKLPLKKVLMALKSLPPLWPWVILGMVGMAGLALLRRRSTGVYLAQVLVMGLGTMALEILILVLCQVHLGLLYRQLGLLVAAIMVGMGLGSAWGVRLAARGKAAPAVLAVCQGALALLALFLALTLPSLARAGYLPPDVLLQAIYLALLFMAGFAGGGCSCSGRQPLASGPAGLGLAGRRVLCRGSSGSDLGVIGAEPGGAAGVGGGAGLLGSGRPACVGGGADFSLTIIPFALQRE